MTALTPRRRQVTQLVADGYTNKQIAAVLRISHRRVQRIIADVAAQMGAQQDKDERVQIALWWVDQQKAS